MITAQRRNGINEPLGHSCVNLANLSTGRHFTVHLEDPHSCACLLVTLNVEERYRHVGQEHWDFSLLVQGTPGIQQLLFFDGGRCAFDLSVNRTPTRYDWHYVLTFYFLNIHGNCIQTHVSDICGGGPNNESRNRNDYTDSTVLLCPNFAEEGAVFELAEGNSAAVVYLFQEEELQ